MKVYYINIDLLDHSWRVFNYFRAIPLEIYFNKFIKSKTDNFNA